MWIRQPWIIGHSDWCAKCFGTLTRQSCRSNCSVCYDLWIHLHTPNCWYCVRSHFMFNSLWHTDFMSKAACLFSIIISIVGYGCSSDDHINLYGYQWHISLSVGSLFPLLFELACSCLVLSLVSTTSVRSVVKMITLELQAFLASDVKSCQATSSITIDT